MPIVVIGGGISGLACAWRLRNDGRDVILLEKSSRLGGLLESAERDGFLFELGPQSILSTPAVLDLVRALGLESEFLQADPRAPRFILLGGKLRPAPLSPPALLASPLLGLSSKLRLFAEPFRRTRPPADDESIADFVRRKFSSELLENLVGPFVSGVYAGDPEQLSLRSAFPSIHEWESRLGSVIRGAMKSRPPRDAPRATLCSFRKGIGQLADALAKSLGEAVRTCVRVESLRALQADQNSRWEIVTQSLAGRETFVADAVVLATPAPAAGNILSEISPRLESLLGGVEYAPVAVVSGGYRREHVAHALNGFGFLVPRKEGLKILGTVWNSSLFRGRAPRDCVSLASFVGGATDPEIVAQSEEEIARRVESELAPLLGISGSPVARFVMRHAMALPQYDLGHAARIAELRTELARFPRLVLTGNYFQGPSVGSCIDQGFAAAQQVANYS